MDIYQFFELNRHIVIFIYGMIFFAMGFGILIKNRQLSRFCLAKSLLWLAFFGIAHAIADWGHLFIPLQKGYASVQTYIFLRTIRIIINALSFAFLLQFGISLLINARKVPEKLKYIPSILFGLWLAELIGHIVFQNIEGDELLWVRVGDIWSRYLMAFPGAMLSGLAIWLQRREFIQYGQTRFIIMLKLASASLIFYGVAAGIMVPQGPVFLATIVNSNLFFTLTGLPIELLRAGTGLLIAVSILRIIQVFDKEYISRLQESEKDKAILDERNRIAQDLHDGIIQNMYATNLQLEIAKHLVASNPAEATEKLSVCISKRNEIISQIREYIGELKRVTETKVSLKERVDDLLDEMGVRDRMRVRFEYSYEEDEISITVLYHLTLVMKEAISNVIKHSGAKELRVHISGNSTELKVAIVDNGIGFCPQTVYAAAGTGEKQGVKNMQERIAALNGEIEITSAVKKGTTISIKIPSPGGAYDKVIDS